MTASSFSLLIDGQSVPVAIVRHHAARRWKLRYDATAGALRLTMPLRGDVAGARRWAAQQDEWIRRQIATQTRPQLVGAGTLLPYGDNHLLIDWSATARRAPAMSNDRLTLGGPAELIGARVRRWLIDQARREFTGATKALATQAGLHLASVSLGDPRARWGSCASNGRIRYSWRLIMAPQFVQQSVVAHEVAHLAHMHHGPAFHQLAEQLLGTDPTPARRWLAAHGRGLHGWQFDGGVSSAASV